MLLHMKVSACLTDDESGSVVASLRNASMWSIVRIAFAIVETQS